jgi:hypothetical protein
MREKIGRETQEIIWGAQMPAVPSSALALPRAVDFPLILPIVVDIGNLIIMLNKICRP